MLVAVDLQLLLCAPDGVRCFCTLRYIFFHCSLALARWHLLLTTFHFLIPFCCLAVRSSLMVELSGILSTPYATAHLVHNFGGCCYDSYCIMALSQKLTQRQLHE